MNMNVQINRLQMKKMKVTVVHKKVFPIKNIEDLGYCPSLVGVGGWWRVLCLERVHRQIIFVVHDEIYSLALKTNEPKREFMVLSLDETVKQLVYCYRFSQTFLSKTR